MFEIGLNLTSNQFDKDRAEVVARAEEAGLSGMLITGTSLEESQQAQTLAAQYPDYCWSTAGVHPHQASQWDSRVEQAIRALAAEANVVAIGECGLDFNRNFSTPADQERAFTAQLALAAELSLPVFLHCRDAHPRFAELLTPWLPKLPGAVLHCFTGSQQELEHYLSLGLSIGITGWVCDERRGLELREMLPLIPVDRLLLETDAPYLLPRDLENKPKNRRNEPCFLPHIVRQVALWRAKDEDPVWLAQITDDNARRLFKI
ncbi:3'-5' ssDNA/RNA exonuclease TatD [Rouxiella badensis]|uniref:3'-5' ssDNA/RNA exonuclease TatD n=1 Tax=Rouxiella badensis TaxID=1646377 RepID=UPI0022AA0243|nr:3'-5' ssDNA/RNA exonuclease TatD [Rouxiella badensis]WAT08031.1 3'-5' ssDNA/RNA exonuclease TatD [Rouxiella badensis]